MDWEACYRAGDTPWEKGRAHPALETLLPGHLPDGDVLVPGCGGGHDVLALARLYPGRRVIGVDIAESAVQSARARCSGHPNASILQADVLEDALDGMRVALLWEHTCFCAIPPAARSLYAERAAARIVADGILAGVFFLNLERRGDGPPWNCPEPELRAHFSGGFSVEVLGPSPTTFPGRELEEFAVRMKRLREA